MMNLMEIMQAAQGGHAMENLARQFNISTEQAQAAVGAVLPAMSMGLQRQAESANMMSQFLGALASGQHAQAFENQDKDGDGVPDYLQQQGNNVLGMLFGSKDVSRAVAGQAAQFAGVSDQLIRSMLPVIASMVMGGLFKGMNNQGFGGLLGQIASGMMPGAGGAQAGGGSLADMLGKMMGGSGMGSAPTGSAQQPSNPFGGLFGNVLGSMFPGPARPQPQAQSTPAPANPMQAGIEALQDMFRTGQQVQQAQVSGLQQIFDQMMSATRRPS